MSRSQVPIVYLDSQDFSRFGDVLRGKGQSMAEGLYYRLCALKADGAAIFVTSMPLLGELLQYHPNFRETTICKAQAVEQLCGSNAIMFPSRLIAVEIAQVAQVACLTSERALPSAVSSDRYWYPDVSSAFVGLKTQFQETLESEIGRSQFVNRAQRRNAKRLGRKMDMIDLMQEAAPAMAAQFGLPLNAITGSIVAVLRGKATPTQASRKLFSAIAEPTKFVEIYFERVETDRSLPQWIGGTGIKFQNAFEQLRQTLQPYMHLDFAREQFRSLLAENRRHFRLLALRLAEDDIEEFGLSHETLRAIEMDDTLLDQVPACRIMEALIEAYVLQVLGYSGGEPNIEGGFAGDLVHALYLPHVDLWRTDGRFANLVAAALPEYASRVVRKPRDLEAAIAKTREELASQF